MSQLPLGNNPLEANSAVAGADVGALPSMPDAIAIDVRNFNFFYGAFQALDDITMGFAQKRISGLIGASVCGKSTLLRALNRMHDNTPGTRGEGELIFDGENILEMQNLVNQLGRGL